MPQKRPGKSHDGTGFTESPPPSVGESHFELAASVRTVTLPYFPVETTFPQEPSTEVSLPWPSIAAQFSIPGAMFWLTVVNDRWHFAFALISRARHVSGSVD